MGVFDSGNFSQQNKLENSKWKPSSKQASEDYQAGFNDGFVKGYDFNKE